ncbi:hypothetical protein [Streptococcus dysgalactiae]|uniref:hypothetical protein n=1 Tax=Streptococcus dysgalactiae TaxID=1334 RepID=UPI001C6E666F|nr:hypothetical protein [Streptococcus dysgalactiae]
MNHKKTIEAMNISKYKRGYKQSSKYKEYKIFPPQLQRVIGQLLEGEQNKLFPILIYQFFEHIWHDTSP